MPHETTDRAGGTWARQSGSGDASRLWPLKRCSDGLAVIYLADARQLPIVICHGQDLTQQC